MGCDIHEDVGVRLASSGRLAISSSVSDRGTGTYTLVAQVAADTLAFPLDRIDVTPGDSSLSAAPPQGGSWTAASTGAAVRLACAAIGEDLIAAAMKMGGKPLGDARRETLTDHRLGRFMNHSFAEYHVPTDTYIDNIELIFVNEPDPEVTPLGIKGLGEIGIVGTATAVANTISHATGKQVRSLPVTIDNLL